MTEGLSFGTGKGSGVLTTPLSLLFLICCRLAGQMALGGHVHCSSLDLMVRVGSCS